MFSFYKSLILVVKKHFNLLKQTIYSTYILSVNTEASQTRQS